jgi:hypothetical protein
MCVRTSECFVQQNEEVHGHELPTALKPVGRDWWRRWQWLLPAAHCCVVYHCIEHLVPYDAYIVWVVVQMHEIY